jgi:uncharacterized protein YbjT (DUF2867 family)
MKVVIAGGTGLIGRALVERLIARRDQSLSLRATFDARLSCRKE